MTGPHDRKFPDAETPERDLPEWDFSRVSAGARDEEAAPWRDADFARISESTGRPAPARAHPQAKRRWRLPRLPRPALPQFSFPRLRLPRFSVPRLRLPRVSVPRFSFPRIALPRPRLPRFSLPRFSLPRFSLPRFSLPRFSLPRVHIRVPRWRIPAIGWPRMRLPRIALRRFQLPRVDVPRIAWRMPRLDPVRRAAMGRRLRRAIVVTVVVSARAADAALAGAGAARRGVARMAAALGGPGTRRYWQSGALTAAGVCLFVFATVSATGIWRPAGEAPPVNYVEAGPPPAPMRVPSDVELAQMRPVPVPLPRVAYRAPARAQAAPQRPAHAGGVDADALLANLVLPAERRRVFPLDRAATAEAQVRLLRLGYAPGVPTGRLSVRTRQAIALFQKDAGLSVTGTVDTATIERLRRASAS